MSIMQQVRERVALAQPGQVLTYADFQVNEGQLEALAAALSRLTKQGVINRLAKGCYYKPRRQSLGK